MLRDLAVSAGDERFAGDIATSAILENRGYTKLLSFSNPLNHRIFGIKFDFADLSGLRAHFCPPLIQERMILWYLESTPIN